MGKGSKAWSTCLSLSTGSEAVLSKDCRTFEATRSPSSLESFSSAAASQLNEAKHPQAEHKGMSACRGADTPGVSKELLEVHKAVLSHLEMMRTLFFILVWKERENPELYPQNYMFSTSCLQKRLDMWSVKGLQYFYQYIKCDRWSGVRIQSKDTSVL